MTVGVESAMVAPAQYGPPLEAEGVAGTVLTMTSVAPVPSVQVGALTVTAYLPAFAMVAASVGCRSVEVKPFGPVQAYVAPDTLGVDSWIVEPAQYGPLLVAVTVAGGQVGQAPGPAVVSTKPETVPLNTDDVVVPVVLTTTTKFAFAGTVNEYDALPTVVPSPLIPLSPR